MSVKILGIESSCDETAASVSLDGRTILSNIVASQVEEHKKFGGVVPEIASRRHCENILDTVRMALDEAHCTLDDLDGPLRRTHHKGVELARGFRIGQPHLRLQQGIESTYRQSAEDPRGDRR